MSEMIPVTVTLTFIVDPEKWQAAYGETITPTDADDVKDYFNGLEVTDLIPAAGEWMADKPKPSVTVAVNDERFK